MHMLEEHRDGGLIGDYLTAEQAAKQLGITRRTLDAMCARREGPPRTRIGRRVYYRKEALADWLLQQEHRQARSRASRRATR